MIIKHEDTGLCSIVDSKTCVTRGSPLSAEELVDYIDELLEPGEAIRPSR